VVILDGDRSIRVTRESVITVDGRQVVLEHLKPGASVSIATGEVVAAAAGVRHTVRGTVTDVDRDGEITVKVADGDEFDIHLPRTTAANLRKGDAVTLEITFVPGNVPSERTN
jgi:hypothetical protein